MEVRCSLTKRQFYGWTGRFETVLQAYNVQQTAIEKLYFELSSASQGGYEIAKLFFLVA